MQEALRTGLVSNYSMSGALRASPSVSEMVKNVGYLDKLQAIVNYFHQAFERNGENFI